MLPPGSPQERRTQSPISTRGTGSRGAIGTWAVHTWRSKPAELQSLSVSVPTSGSEPTRRRQRTDTTWRQHWVTDNEVSALKSAAASPLPPLLHLHTACESQVSYATSLG